MLLLLVLVGVYTIFHNPIFNSIDILSNEYNFTYFLTNYYITSCDFFTAALADGLLLEFE